MPLQDAKLTRDSRQLQLHHNNTPVANHFRHPEARLAVAMGDLQRQGVKAAAALAPEAVVVAQVELEVAHVVGSDLETICYCMYVVKVAYCLTGI